MVLLHAGEQTVSVGCCNEAFAEAERGACVNGRQSSVGGDEWR